MKAKPKDPMEDLDEILDARANGSGTKETGTAVAIPDDDGFAIAGEFADRNMLRGQLPKFIDGIWSLGGQQLPREGKYAVVGVKACMVRWEDQRPVEYIFARPSGLLPHRESLSHQDKGEWPAGPDGQPSDPWRNTRFIYLVNTATAEDFTYTNSTLGTRKAY